MQGEASLHLVPVATMPWVNSDWCCQAGHDYRYASKGCPDTRAAANKRQAQSTMLRAPIPS